MRKLSVLLALVFLASFSAVMAETRKEKEARWEREWGGRAPIFHIPEAWESSWRHQFEFEVGYQSPEKTSRNLRNAPSIGIFYYHRVAQRLFLSAGLAYQNYPYTYPNYPWGEGHMSVMPLTVGIKYNLTTSGVQPYIGLESGIYFISATAVKQGGSDIVSDTNRGFLAKIGIRVPISPNIEFDGNYKYHWEGKNNMHELQHGINAGLAFSL